LARFHWLRIGLSSGLFWTRQWTFTSRKRCAIWWLAERLSASQEEHLHIILPPTHIYPKRSLFFTSPDQKCVCILIVPMRSARPANLILDFIALMITREKYKSWITSLFFSIALFLPVFEPDSLFVQPRIIFQGGNIL
jgi:hypothetical protein